MNLKRAIAFVLVFGFLAPLAGAQPEVQPQLQTKATVQRLELTVQDAEALLTNDWLGTYFQGKKIGFFNETREKLTENGQTYYRVGSKGQMKLVALGQKGEIKQERNLDFDSQPPFALLRAEFSLDDSNSKKCIKIVAKDQGYEATITVGNVTQKKMMTGVDCTLADLLSPMLWLKKGPATGETITTRDFSFTELETSLVTSKVLGTKEIIHGGAKVKVYEVERIEHDTKMTSLLRYDAKAQLVWILASGVFELRRESESTAKKTEFGDDLIMQTMAKIDQPLGDQASVKGLVLKGKGKHLGLLPNNALQTISHEGDDVYVLKIGKHHGKQIKAAEKDIADALKETTAYPIQDAKVVELAKKAIGDAKTDQEKVQRLCKFVHEYIKYEIVYAPKVHDILERKVGDCQSYALLFACLSRAVGVPAREAYGYLYMGDEIKGFGGHAWNEVVLDGHWVQVDATLGITHLVPFYIFVGNDAFDNQTQGKLSFQVVEVERT